MADFNWCHGPECHTKQTQSRIRGYGDNKVLRTIKISLGNNYRTNYPEYYLWQYFCGNHCLFDFIRLHLTSIIAIAPRTKALETPIKVEKEKYESTRWDYGSNIDDRPQRVPYMATRTTIKSVDNNDG